MPANVSALDVAVVGGGVIGAACARAAAQAGLRTAIFEPGPDPAAASAASAGMLAAQIEPSDDATLALAVRARELCAALAPVLKDSTGTDIGLWRPGIASLAFGRDAAERLRDGAARQRQAGLRAEWLEPEDVPRRWPGVTRACEGAFFAPDDGAVDPRALTRALLADARRHGATLVSQRVERTEITAGRIQAVTTPAGRTAAGHVVLAAGAWSPLIEGLPRRLPVEPVRGQLAMTAWPAGVPAVIVYGDHGYVLARGPKAILGSTMERAGFECRTTSEGLAHILRAATRLVPALGTMAAERAWAGLRPVTEDGAAIVGADPEVGGLWYATGHGRNGILFAGLTGKVLGDLLTAGATDLDVSLWSPERLTAAS